VGTNGAGVTVRSASASGESGAFRSGWRSVVALLVAAMTLSLLVVTEATTAAQEQPGPSASFELNPDTGWPFKRSEHGGETDTWAFWPPCEGLATPTMSES
jgi:hypothetical protein